MDYLTLDKTCITMIKLSFKLGIELNQRQWPQNSTQFQKNHKFIWSMGLVLMTQTSEKSMRIRQE